MAAFEFEPHRFKPNKTVRRMACVCCGLVLLKNQFTEWSRQVGCNGADHPDYRRVRKHGIQSGS